MCICTYKYYRADTVAYKHVVLTRQCSQVFTLARAMWMVEAVPHSVAVVICILYKGKPSLSTGLRCWIRYQPDCSSFIANYSWAPGSRRFVDRIKMHDVIYHRRVSKILCPVSKCPPPMMVAMINDQTSKAGTALSDCAGSCRRMTLS